MFAKVSRNGLQFFAHAQSAPNCALALETLAHHLLKLELANAARDAGARAELEVRGPDGAWRADVMASDHGGTWRMALEAQLSPITVADVIARTERMRADSVTSVWFSDRPRLPWLGTVPSVRLAQPDNGQCLLIAEGLVRFDGLWGAVPATLVEFLGWVFTRRIVPHWPMADFRPPLTPLAMVWTAQRYIRAETSISPRKRPGQWHGCRGRSTGGMSFVSSPWIRRCPRSGFSFARRTARRAMLWTVGGRPGLRRLLVSYFFAASLRCQASSVAGLTGKTSLQRLRV
jgi:hypothetical protein